MLQNHIDKKSKLMFYKKNISVRVLNYMKNVLKFEQHTVTIKKAFI